MPDINELVGKHFTANGAEFECKGVSVDGDIINIDVEPIDAETKEG